ncbi:CBS domain-containing protein [Actinophytocola sp. NPDC049390]|uniref:CBS domain-containing protein n=1 Tax=Actinophytocola sp. NPDC049390 TaxID=3363894 RepID=UPI00379D77D2
MTVAAVMTTSVVAVVAETSVPDVVATMTETGLSALPVVDADGLPLGVVSDADLLPVFELPRPRGRTAVELMGGPVRAVHTAEPVSFVADVFARNGMRRLFVTDWDGRLVGVVSRRDLHRTGARSMAAGRQVAVT